MDPGIYQTITTVSIPVRAATYPLGLWVFMALVAVLNGGFRELVLVPRIGSYPGHVLSTALLVSAILGLSYLFFRTIAIPYDVGQLMVIGAGWVVLTVVFEFLVGHLEGTPVSVTLGQYNVLAGQVWIAVPLALLVTPLAFGWHLSG